MNLAKASLIYKLHLMENYFQIKHYVLNPETIWKRPCLCSIHFYDSSFACYLQAMHTNSSFSQHGLFPRITAYIPITGMPLQLYGTIEAGW